LNILFITHTRIGDAIMSSGILRHLVEAYPTARFTVACGPLAASLFAEVPRLERVILVTKQKFDAHWYALWKQVRGTVWDIVVDLRRSLISHVIPVHKRYVVGPIAPGVHHVAHLSQLMSLSQPATPHLHTSQRHNVAAALAVPDGAPVLALAPVAATLAKTWPAESFTALAAHLTSPGGLCAGWRVALFGGPGDEDVAQPLTKALRGCIRIFNEPDLLTVQAALARCGGFIGNDSGLAHLAVSTGIPTLALFGATDSCRYSPWGGSVVLAPHQKLQSLDVNRVAAAFVELLKSH
jgi:heptosyltransferase III